jgi:hypothetical protein
MELINQAHVTTSILGNLANIIIIIIIIDCLGGLVIRFPG